MPQPMTEYQKNRLLEDFKKSSPWLALMPFVMMALKAFLAFLESRNLGITPNEV